MHCTLSNERPSLALVGIYPWCAAFEFVSHHRAPAEAKPAAGDGHPVIIFPGKGTHGTAVAPLRRYCQSLGYKALDWGRGFNRGPEGDIDAWLDDLKGRTTQLLSGFEQSATFIGWSLGGIYARELSKTMGPRVRQVITIGTARKASRPRRPVVVRLAAHRCLRGQPVGDLRRAEARCLNAARARHKSPPPGVHHAFTAAAFLGYPDPHHHPDCDLHLIDTALAR